MNLDLKLNLGRYFALMRKHSDLMLRSKYLVKDGCLDQLNYYRFRI